MTPDATLLHGDALDMLRTLPDASVDAVVTDPPAGIAFMGKSWDTDKGGRDAWIAWLASIMGECRRVMKPGAHALVWSLPRTSHWTGMALENAGLEPRDTIAHMFGSGFPKSLDVSKAIDKAARAERRVVGSYKGATNIGKGSSNSYIVGDARAARTTVAITEPATPEAQAWQGWGTALKPSHEVWWLCRKPLAAGTVAANVLAYGTGALNITACRAGDEVTITQVKDFTAIHGNKWGTPRASTPTLEYKENPPGRWPPNVLLSHSIWCVDGACDERCPVRTLGEQSGVSVKASSGVRGRGSHVYANGKGYANTLATVGQAVGYGDTGTAARFYPNFPAADPADAVPFLYQSKASRNERTRGLDCTEIITVQWNQANDIAGGSKWVNEGREVRLLVDTAQSRPRVIAGYGISSNTAFAWSTFLFGSDTTDMCQKACRFTTATMTSSTTESKTLNWLTRSLTSDCTAVANCETVNGGSLAESAENGIPLLTITCAETAYLPGVGHVPSQTQLRISGGEKQAASHPTVKSLALMAWLVRLITPPGGVVLDPFMGSGSTGVACMREGFDFIGIEREYDYWQIASARTAHAQFAVAEQPDPPPMPKQRRHSPSIPRASGNGGKVSQDSLLHGCG